MQLLCVGRHRPMGALRHAQTESISCPPPARCELVCPGSGYGRNAAVGVTWQRSHNCPDSMAIAGIRRLGWRMCLDNRVGLESWREEA